MPTPRNKKMPVTPMPTPEPVETGSGLKKSLTVIFVLVVAIGLFTAVYLYSNSTQGTSTGPVARVNDAEISRTDYNNSVRVLAQSAAAQGFDVNDSTIQTQIQTQALTSLINTELLLQAARDDGVTVSDADVQTEYETVAQSLGGEGALQTQLANNNITEEELRADITNQLAIRAYISAQLSSASVDATGEEVTEVYNQLALSGYELPELSTIETAIGERLRAEKERGFVFSLIDSLREGATIEILI